MSFTRQCGSFSWIVQTIMRVSSYRMALGAMVHAWSMMMCGDECGLDAVAVGFGGAGGRRAAPDLLISTY